MLTKACRAPKGGRSATALAEYMVGYALCEKGASKEEIREALDGVYVEAELRDDLGVDVIWSPTAGHGTRPSSILVRNCSSFATAAMEMDADCVNTQGVKTSSMHLVQSWQTADSGKLTEEQIHAMAERHLEKLGLSHHRYMIVVHRDTIVYDRELDGTIKRDAEGNAIVKDGNIHAHIQVGVCDPQTGLAYDRTGFHRKISRADREIEQEFGIETDRGLCVIRDRGLSTERIEDATSEELRAWRLERREERLAAMERRSFEGYMKQDGTFERYADATVAPRLQAAIDTATERGRKIDWADLHAVAARYGCALENDDDGHVILRDVGIGQMKFEHRKEIEQLRRDLKEQHADRDEIDRQVSERKAEQTKLEAAERERKTTEGGVVRLDSVLENVAGLPQFRSVADSERDIVERVEAQPEIVLRDVTAQSSTFSREDVDAWLFERISDPEEIERLGDLVMRHESIRVLNVDTQYALMTTTEILAVEDKLAEDARALAHTDSGVTKEQIATAIATYEMEQSKKYGKAFRLTDEQRKAVFGIAGGSLVSIEGLPGTGKTTVMGAVRVLGEQTGREVVGITLSQAAAERLQSEAGFRCVNSSRALLLEEGGDKVIPDRGIVVVDEAAMMDSRANGRVLDLARQRSCIGFEIYDTRQLQPIDFGASARLIRDAAMEVGAHYELRDIQRQKNAWHREAVAIMADAIVEKDESKRTALVKRSLDILDANGAIRWVKDRSEAIEVAVQQQRVDKALGMDDALLIAANKDTVRHLNEQSRKVEGREGTGMTFVTKGGKRELAVGDSLVFLENSTGKRGLGVLNGDRGEVVSVAHDKIAVRMHGSESVIEFKPTTYKTWDHASALTTHKSQGASVSAGTSVYDPSASAELVFVAMSRSQRAITIVTPKTAAENTAQLAEQIANRISLKTTTRNYEEIVERTGGKQTMRVLNIEQQREAVNSPLRRRFDAEVREPALALRMERLKELRAGYSAAKKAIEKDASLSLTQRLEKRTEALSVFRSRAAEIYAETKTSYHKWLDKHEETHAKSHAHTVQREAARQKQIERDVKIRSRDADDRRRTPEKSYEREIFPDHGYER